MNAPEMAPDKRQRVWGTRTPTPVLCRGRVTRALSRGRVDRLFALEEREA